MSAATAVALPHRRNVEQLQWLAPAPLWDAAPAGAAASGLAQPWIAELRSDSFVSDFLGLLGGRNGVRPDDLADTVPHRTVGGAAGAPYRLFQPLSQCYYLVSATLVCRRPGIPDHAVKRAKGERVSFVMRRVVSDGGEQAWIPSDGKEEPGSPPTGVWVTAQAGELVAGEEKHPMHPAPVAAFASPGSAAATLGMAAGTASSRTVHYGYIPVGRRERMVPALTDPVAALAAYQPPVGTAPENPWLFELLNRVVEPWQMLTKPPRPEPKTVKQLSLYVLLDLADWLSKYLPKVYQAIITESSVSDAEDDLLDLLRNTTVQDSGEPVPITDALVALKDLVPLVNGPTLAKPDTYDLSLPPLKLDTDVPRDNWFGPAKKVDPPHEWSLAYRALLALQQAATDPAYHPQLPPEFQGMIKIDPVERPQGTAAPSEPSYIIRVVFEHHPCQPVLSAPSHQFVLAGPIDAEAPARKVRIQLPDITNLRQFQRGVAFEMSPSMRRIMEAVTPDSAKKILDGEFSSGSGMALGMICSFSLQIIFVVAFIILLIFVMLLNIVFWWKAFLKICFPIPTKAAAAKASQP